MTKQEMQGWLVVLALFAFAGVLLLGGGAPQPQATQPAQGGDVGVQGLQPIKFRNVWVSQGLKVTDSGLTIDSGGQTITAGGQTITAGGQTITAGGQTITAGGSNIVAGGLLVQAGGVTANAGTITGTLSAYGLSATAITGTVGTASQPNITNLGTQAYLTATNSSLGAASATTFSAGYITATNPISMAGATFTGPIKYGAASTYNSGAAITHGFTTTPTVCGLIGASALITASVQGISSTTFSLLTEANGATVYWMCGK